MNILLVLIPVTLLVVIVAVWLFFWAVNHQQFDDLDSPSVLPLMDDPAPEEPAPEPPGETGNGERTISSACAARVEATSEATAVPTTARSSRRAFSSLRSSR